MLHPYGCLLSVQVLIVNVAYISAPGANFSEQNQNVSFLRGRTLGRCQNQPKKKKKRRKMTYSIIIAASCKCYDCALVCVLMARVWLLHMMWSYSYEIMDVSNDQSVWRICEIDNLSNRSPEGTYNVSSLCPVPETGWPWRFPWELIH